MNTLVQAAWGVLLGRLTGAEDVVFGATVSGRPADLPGVESMVGLFINTLPVRVAFDPDEPVSAFLERLQGEQAALLGHHHLGLTEIQRATSPSVAFDTLTVFESYPLDEEALAEQSASIDGMAVTGVGTHDATHYPLSLFVHLRPRSRSNCVTSEHCSTAPRSRRSSSVSSAHSRRWRSNRRCRSATSRCSVPRNSTGSSTRGTTPITTSTGPRC
ncbi:hypothetical protein NJ76_00025 [Rhodococcus sp. IITR03]|nr:hypothetical protein NJ76_00025 [Rhodococcus sp. IITR03]